MQRAKPKQPLKTFHLPPNYFKTSRPLSTSPLINSPSHHLIYLLLLSRSLSLSRALPLPLSLSLSHTHPPTHPPSEKSKDGEAKQIQVEKKRFSCWKGESNSAPNRIHRRSISLRQQFIPNSLHFQDGSLFSHLKISCS